jgi:hypothetical protein
MKTFTFVTIEIINLFILLRYPLKTGDSYVMYFFIFDSFRMKLKALGIEGQTQHSCFSTQREQIVLSNLD